MAVKASRRLLWCAETIKIGLPGWASWVVSISPALVTGQILTCLFFLWKRKSGVVEKKVWCQKSEPSEVLPAWLVTVLALEGLGPCPVPGMCLNVSTTWTEDAGPGLSIVDVSLRRGKTSMCPRAESAWPFP
jgi:hypothetical protein